MKIGITGASGHLGSAAVKHLIARVSPSDVVAITRFPEKIKDLAQTGVQIRAGDFDDRKSLASAFRGLDRLLLIPTSDLHTGVRKAQHLAAVDAAEEFGVGHVVYISTVGARPDGKDALFESHFVTEQALIRTGVAWTFLRANLYTDFLLGPVKRALATGVYSAGLVAPIAHAVRDDIAAAAAGILATSGHEGKMYFATGPASVTAPDIVAAISAASGKAVRFAEITDEQFRQALEAENAPQVVIDLLLDMQANIRAGAFDIVTGDIARLSGKKPESVLDFLRRNQAALSAGA